MLFNSYPFIFLFLPITLAGFFALGRRSRRLIFLFLPIILAGFFALGRRSRRLVIVWLALASLFFCGWSNPVYVGLLLFASPRINWSTTSRSWSVRSTPTICARTDLICWTLPVRR